MAGTDYRKALTPEQDRKFTLLRLSQLYEQKARIDRRILMEKETYALRNPDCVIE